MFISVLAEVTTKRTKYEKEMRMGIKVFKNLSTAVKAKADRYKDFDILRKEYDLLGIDRNVDGIRETTLHLERVLVEEKLITCRTGDETTEINFWDGKTVTILVVIALRKKFVSGFLAPSLVQYEIVDVQAFSSPPAAMDALCDRLGKWNEEDSEFLIRTTFLR